MSLDIDNKVYRNMQEQVAYNSRCIKAIKDYLDGLDVQDSVIVLENMSPLNSKQMKVAEEPLAFIVYDEAIYLKIKEDATYYYFEKMLKMELGTVITLSSAVIQVTKLNGATGITVSSVNVYSKSQIDASLGLKANVSYVDTELAKKADLTGASFSGAVSAPTLLQAEANYKAEFVINPDAGLPYSLEQIYNRFIQINQGLEIVVNLAIKNETENAITVGKIGASLPVLPTSLATQLVDFLGHKVSEAGVAQTIIASAQAVIYKASNAGLGTAQGASFGKIILSNAAVANQCQVYVAADSGVSIPANTTYYLTGRISLTLI